jgi:hypothetical protein
MSNSARSLRFLGGVTVAASTVMVVASCGGGGGDSGGVVTPPPATGLAVIDTAGVTKAVTDFGSAISVCQDGATGSVQSGRAVGVAASIQRGMAALQGRMLGATTKRALALTGTPPADQLGSCGGRYGYRNYSHVNGTTTATLAFENYCQSGAKAGETQTTNGSIAFVNAGTPSASGPITTQLDANSNGPVTTVLKNAAGATVSADTLSFSGFRMVVGVPGGTPTAASPDVMSMSEMSLRNDVTGKTYRQTGYRVTGYEDAAGNSSWTLAGRGHRSDGSYFDIATPQPVVQNADGDTVGGQMSFTGANGSTAVATVVPGTTLQVKLTVNGTPLLSVPACVK